MFSKMGLALAICAFGGAPLRANISSLNESTIKEFDNINQYEDKSIISLGVKDRKLLIYWIDKNANIAPDRVFLADNYNYESNNNTYKNYSLKSSIVSEVNTTKIYQFKCDYIVKDNTPFLINSLRYSFGSPGEIDYPAGIEYTYHKESDSFTSKTYQTEKVKDKLVSYWNVASGDKTNILYNPDFGYINNSTERIFTEHYLAFNFESEIDNILSISINTDWAGYTGVLKDTTKTSELYSTATDSPADYWGKEANTPLLSDWIKTKEYQNTGLDSFKSYTKSSLPAYLKNDYFVTPKDVTKSLTEKTIFGLKLDVTKYSWNTIEDLQKVGEYDSFKDKFETIFGSDSNGYSKVSHELWGDNPEKPKFRWFINFEETPFAPKITNYYTGVFGNTKKSAEKIEFVEEYPLLLAQDTTIVEITYQKAGNTIKSLVIDSGKDSTINPITPFEPKKETSDFSKILTYILLALIVCVVLSACALLFPLLKVAGKGILSAFKVLAVILYMPVWLVRVIVAKVQSKQTPALWFWNQRKKRY